MAQARPGSPQPRRRLSWRRRLLFSLVPLLALLLLAEVAVRLGRAPLHFGSFRALRLDLMARNYPAELDDRLGYVPRPDFVSRDNHWGTLVSIDADGLRQNGDAAAPAGPLVVAVGDSFTFGDEVDDDETWPAALERRLDRPVKNGGVFGYSLVQTVLRGEQLVERYRPRTLVVSLIANDLRRCTYSRRYTLVPWFDLRDDGGLELRGVPIDHGDARSEPPDAAWKNALGHSALIDAVLASTSREWWFEQDKQTPVDHLWAHTDELGRRIADRVLAFCRANDVEPLLVLQGLHANEASTAMLRHAEAIGLPTLDLVARFHALAAEQPALRDEWFDGHMTAAGNAWVAEQIAGALAR